MTATPLQPFTFDSQDLGEIEALLSQSYSRMRLGANSEDTRARIIRRVLTSGVVFDDLDYRCDVGYAASEPSDRIVLCEVLGGTIESFNDGSEGTFGPGDQFLIAEPGRIYAGLGHAARMRYTLLDPAVFARTVSEDAEWPVRLLDHQPVSPQAATGLSRAISYVRNSVLPVQSTPLVVSTVEHFLAAHVLAAYPNTTTIEPAAADRHDGHPKTLRRAVAFIEANPDLDITVADIARSAAVSPRALQIAFRRHLDTTPMAYLRRVRLSHAHQDLLDADPGEGITVTRVALDWGFTSPSRFAAYYREAYGVSPSQTLAG